MSHDSGQIPLLDLVVSYGSVLLWPMLNTEFVRNRSLAPQICQSLAVGDGVEAYKKRFQRNEEFTAESPVFIFSAGWGCGSTLLQRLLISSGELTIWGEPVDEAGPVMRMADSMSAIREHWPPAYHFRRDVSSEQLSKAWIANYSPDMVSFKNAHRAFIKEWLSDGDKVNRWGLKEVRLTIDHAVYLKWLFPNAKFLFIYRDVYSSYLSVRRRAWWSLWPDYPATRIVSFAHHWNYLLSGYLERVDEVDGMLIKYEDLISGEICLSELATYVGISGINDDVLGARVGGRSARRKPLILLERVILDRIAGNMRKKAGYL